MRFLIGSDIHGSLYYGKIFFDKVGTLSPDKILLLGDCYYCGARNDPPKDYAPKEVVKLLNAYSDRILAVKGNCESEVDSMVSDFLFYDKLMLYVFDKEITCVHGHHESFTALPKHPGDVFLQGHTHVGVLERKDKTILANPGSVSLPKDGRHSYLVLDENGFALKDLLTDETVKSLSF